MAVRTATESSIRTLSLKKANLSHPDRIRKDPVTISEPTRKTSERYVVMGHGHPCVPSPLDILPSPMRALLAP